MLLQDWEGNPTNTMIQKDASEFLGMLFMQVEMRLQGSPQEHLLKEVFGGSQQNELIADGKYSAREEPFTFLSVEIKNKKDLASAMRTFISGETVDYKWENEDGTKVEMPTQKRQSLKSLPDHLIIHLKRFEFDYETMQNSKLNDRFEFPRDLDLYEFTADGRPDKVTPPTKEKSGEGAEEGKAEATADDAPAQPAHPRSYYQYQLAGIVVHSGTAHAGHYYSFVRERLAGGKLGRWMMFNDSSVSPFKEDMIERETFGGVETFKYAYSNVTQSHAVTRNAFMLFYDRVPAEPVGAPVADAATLLSAASTGPVRDASELATQLVTAHRSKASAQSVNAPLPAEFYEVRISLCFAFVLSLALVSCPCAHACACSKSRRTTSVSGASATSTTRCTSRSCPTCCNRRLHTLARALWPR